MRLRTRPTSDIGVPEYRKLKVGVFGGNVDYLTVLLIGTCITVGSRYPLYSVPLNGHIYHKTYLCVDWSHNHTFLIEYIVYITNDLYFVLSNCHVVR